MKWARKKSSSLITRVFPVSWFSKFKQKSGDHDRNSAKNTKKSVLDFPSPNSSVYRDGRFYSMDEDDAYWRISFGDDRIQPRRSTGGINPLWQDSDHDLENSIFSDFKRFGLAEEAEASRRGRNFSEMVSDIKKMRERRGKEREKDVRAADGGEGELSNSKNPNFDPGRKLKEIKMKTESHVKKTRENSKGNHVKAYSPRTECKVRALEELKKARTKAKKKAPRERVVDGNTVFDSFAVAKSSVDPQRDFKDSMVEMIREKGIGHPDDLEQLLACYLTLNCDEYHDLIITVFRQVWIELKGAYIDPLMRNVSYFDC